MQCLALVLGDQLGVADVETGECGSGSVWCLGSPGCGQTEWRAVGGGKIMVTSRVDVSDV